MIRKASYADIPALYELGKRIHELSADADIPLDEAVVRLHLAGLMAQSDGLVLVDEVDGKITGGLAGYVAQIWYSRKKYAVPLVVYAERRGAFVWLVKRFVKWALQQRRATEVIFDCSFGGALGVKAETVLPKLGFSKSGVAFIKRAEVLPATS